MAKQRIIKTCLKVVDRCVLTLVEDGIETKNYDGYVPKFFPEDHFGDYVQFDIDIDTGQILNWVKPTIKDLKQLDE